jgi:phosphate transport system permease protein
MSRHLKQKLFYWICLASVLATVSVLGLLLVHILIQAWGWISWDFITNFPSRIPEKAGILSAVVGTVYTALLTAAMSIPLGVLTAVYLQEYAPKNRVTEWIEINISNLAGMPSVIYGLLGLAIFVRGLGFGPSLISGSLTMSLLVMPVIVIAAKGALESVPMTLREAAYSLGARKWQVIIFQVLPAAIPGILTGVILAVSRGIGESAPLILTGAMGYVAFLPTSLNDAYTVLPVQIFNWAGRPREEFHYLSAAAITVLLVVLLTMNFIAIIIRNRSQRNRLQ